jgi:hypothetical protein
LLKQTGSKVVSRRDAVQPDQVAAHK